MKSESGKISAYLGFIDPSARRLITNTVIPEGKLKSRYTEVFGKGSDFAGIPQNLFINNNGTVSILFEEMETLKDKNLPGQSIRNVVLATYDADTELKNSYFIPMDHFIADKPLQPFYQSSRELTGQQFLKNNQYKSTAFISDGHNSFILLNDTDLNSQSTAKDKIIPFKEMKDADAFYYQLEGNATAPKRRYAFGKPEGKDVHKTAVFTVYDYDKANNVLVVLKTEKEDAHPGVKLVWVQP